MSTSVWATVFAIPGSVTWRAERFTLSPRLGANVRQRATVWQAVRRIQAPSSTISPHSSAIGMNSDGGIGPSSG